MAQTVSGNLSIVERLKYDIEVQAPVLVDNAYRVTRYADAQIVLRDPRFSNESRKLDSARDWSKAWFIPSIFRALLNSLVMIDDPDHARLKDLVHQGFTPRRIQNMETTIDKMSHELLDKMAKHPNPDLMRDFALPLPLEVISEIMGIPRAKRPQFFQLAGKMMSLVVAKTYWEAAKVLPSALGLNSFFKSLIRMRQRDPQDDLTTALVQAEADGERLSEDELIAMFFLLLLAGHETTVNLIGNGTLLLLEHPEQLAALKQDNSLVETALEEILRFASPIQLVAKRYALETIDVNGTLIPKGSSANTWIGVANRDETVFSNPQVFDIRRNPNKHLGFGFGIHYCLGAPLARLEGKIAFTNLFERYPNLALDTSRELVWADTFSFLGLKSFPVRLNQ